MISINNEFDSLLQYVETLEEFDEKVFETEIQSKKKDEEKNPVFDRYKDNISTLTNFSLFEFEELFYEFDPFFSNRRKSGPKKTISCLDAFFILLLFYKTGLDFFTLSNMLKLPSSKVQRAIKKARKSFNEMIVPKWDPKKFQHKSNKNDILPEVALIIDSTTIEINRPGSYNERKPYFDGKNWIHGLKKQVVIMSVPPFFVLFSFKAFKGGIHDYTFFKSSYTEFLPFLKKRPEDFLSLEEDKNVSWAILADKGYIGSDFPELRKITPFKGKKTREQKKFNKKNQTIESES